jgi:hypothetical protein
MPAPTESGRGRPAEMPPRHPNSPPSTREVRMLTALEDKAATKHAPRSPDRDVGSDDDESMHSVDSHGARIGPYTPERGAPPSYEHVMLSPMPTEPPSTPPRLGHHCSYSGEGERGNHRVLTLFLVACYIHPFSMRATRRATAPATRLADFNVADALCVSATSTSSTGGAEYDSLGFPIPDWLSPRCVPVRNSSRLVGRNDAWNGVSRSARRSKTPKRCVFSRLSRGRARHRPSTRLRPDPKP